MKSGVLAVGLSLLGVLALGSPARAGGTIDATQYVPVGAFNAWEMIDKALWNGGAGTKEEPQIISVTNTFVVDGVPRYNVRTSFFQNIQDVIFQFGVDGGVVYLYGARILEPGEDLGVDDLTVPTVFFDEPVPIGNTTTALDVPFAITPVTSKIKVELDLGPKTISGNVFIEGTVTALWSSEPAIDTPLGTLGGGADPLAELQLNFLFTYSSDDDDINDELEGVVTNKGVSCVMGPGLGFVQIDGQGSQQKIVNKVILPGDLVDNPGDPDAFPPLPPGDLQSFTVAAPGVVSLDGTVEAALGDGGITDGIVTLDNLQLTHTLGGALLLTGLVSAGVDEPADLLMVGTAKPNPKTGGLKVALKGKTKKLPSFAKQVSFAVKQELAPPLDALTSLSLVYNAGKDPITKELITGTLQVPLTPFVGTSANVTINLPVDVPKLKAGALYVNPAKRFLGAEGVLTLSNAALGDGAVKQFPVIFRETATVKEGLPVLRACTLTQTGAAAKLFSLTATSTSPADYALTKFSGKLGGVKIAPATLDEVDVVSQ